MVKLLQRELIDFPGNGPLYDLGTIVIHRQHATPYAVVSGGLATFDPKVSGVSTENRFSASAGLGVKVPMSRNLSVRLEGRGYYAALEDQSDCTFCDYFYNEDFFQGEVNLGLTFSF